MTKYTLYSTKEDWEKVYRDAEKLNLDVKVFKKLTSIDTAYILLKYKQREIKEGAE